MRVGELFSPLAGRRAGLAPHPGNTMELALIAKARVRWPQGCESRKAGPISDVALGRVGPMLQLGSTVEHALEAWVAGEWPGWSSTRDLALMV